MICGLAILDPGACNQLAQVGDPLCRGHAAVMKARAVQGGAKAVAEARRAEQGATSRLLMLGCVVPPELPDRPGMMPVGGRRIAVVEGVGS